MAADLGERVIQGEEPTIDLWHDDFRRDTDAGECASFQDAVGRDAAKIAASAASAGDSPEAQGLAGLPPLLPGAQPSLTWP